MTENSNAKITQKGPFFVEVEAGKQYSWCSCGYSNTQPFCDGSHKDSGTGLKSVKYVAEESKTIAFCGCKRSGNAPLCDGTHGSL